MGHSLLPTLAGEAGGRLLALTPSPAGPTSTVPCSHSDAARCCSSCGSRSTSQDTRALPCSVQQPPRQLYLVKMLHVRVQAKSVHNHTFTEDVPGSRASLFSCHPTRGTAKPVASAPWSSLTPYTRTLLPSGQASPGVPASHLTLPERHRHRNRQSKSIMRQT